MHACVKYCLPYIFGFLSVHGTRAFLLFDEVSSYQLCNIGCCMLSFNYIVYFILGYQCVALLNQPLALSLLIFSGGWGVLSNPASLNDIYTYIMFELLLFVIVHY